ncbi:NAD(P)/FAD-dependent oxidoreductase [Geotoga petraea]|uniref:NAD(P)/FAD-dependent oxidoreductase n=1 Tax=Geotoga petraea TaxID=28234 RepID=A0A4Z0W0P7_9BACT|nr:NAD(P)/FAD-dependent oxidoreductase [Geotoga petraea]
MIYDLIVIGTGPAGLFAAANIKNKKVLILEKNKEIGKKLLVSGTGQCNLTHDGKIYEFFDKYGDKKNYMKKILKRFTNDEAINFFEERGLEFIKDKNGKYFPKSLKAKDVLNILIDEISKKGHEIKTDSKVVKIAKGDNFRVFTKEEEYNSKAVLITTGGKSYPRLGTSGDGYKFAEYFGHSVVRPKPALTPVKIKNFNLQVLSGTSFKEAKVKIKGKDVENTDDLLITHLGFSGPAIIDFSRYIDNNDVLQVSFLNFKNKEVFREDFWSKLKKYQNETIFSVLKKYDLTKKFILKMLNDLSISEKSFCGNINKDNRNNIVDYLIDHEYYVDELFGYDQAMVTAGGIDLKEIDVKTMMSKKVDGLFFAGEVLDVDGNTGGYNIQFALTTGKIVSEFFK